jgi:acetylornithine deacetylase/succinyl-diaminopimelate desuccinylase-like protein
MKITPGGPLLLFVFAATLPAQPPDRYLVDWKAVTPEIMEHFFGVLRIDTTNPPGNETRAAKYLQEVLEKEGIACKQFALDPARANLVARLKGNGSKRPVLVMGHTDVVTTQKDKWTFDPFTPTRKNGFIYARGASDDKPHVAAGLMLLLLLKRMHVQLDRDVIFLAEAGEEGTTKWGIDFMVDKHWEEIDAEYSLAEGGGTTSRGGKVRIVEIGAVEKVPRPVLLVAHGRAGHASSPSADNAVVRIANAVAKVAAWQPPMRLNDVTRAYFERLATISTPEEAARYNHISDPAVQQYLLAHESSHANMLRTTITPTIVKGGFRLNVIPSEAEATLDVRALPDEDMEKFYAELRRVIGDGSVDVGLRPREGAGRPATRPSRTDTDMFRALEHAQQRMFPEAVTLPAMRGGATDNAQLRARGVQAYGFGPVTGEKESHGAHTEDERVLEDSIPKLVEFLWRAVIEVAAAK